MTPEQILDALTFEDELPRDAMLAAGERREELIPLFLACTERLSKASLDTLDEADASAFLFIYFLLGEWRDPRAYRPLITFQLAEVAVTGTMVRAILAAIRRLRAPPSCA